MPSRPPVLNVKRRGCRSAVFNSPSRASATLTQAKTYPRSEEHTSELQSLRHLVCRLLLEKKKNDKPAAGGDSAPPPAVRRSIQRGDRARREALIRSVLIGTDLRHHDIGCTVTAERLRTPV